MSDNNSRIAKNTMALYVRMAFTLVVGLYTGRVVLDKLGVEDYGVYAVVGGVMGSMFFIVSSLRSATHRFIIYGFGENNPEKLGRTFGNIMTVHIAFAAIMVLLGETIGLWWVLNKLVVPDGRLTATIWAYQFSIASVVFEVISAPYNAVIVAHERMDVFAYISIMDVVLKLVIVFIISVCPFDRLVFYTFLLMLVGLLDRIIYGAYCNHHFAETRAGLTFNKSQFKEIFNYASWMAVGNVSNSLADQGFNLLLNLFYGPVVNAARGLAVMIQGIVFNFGDNVQMAIKPQIIKSYAEGDSKRMEELVITGSKVVFFAIFALALPVILEIHQFLSWWLVEVPNWTTQFTIVMLMISCIMIIRNPLYNAVAATGNMRRYQLTNTIVLLAFLPAAYLLLKVYDTPPTTPFIVLLLFYVMNFVATCWVALRQVVISKRCYIKGAILPVVYVVLLAPPVPLFLRYIMGDGVLPFFVVCFMAVVMVLITSYYLGCTRTERIYVKEKVMVFIGRIFKNRNNG